MKVDHKESYKDFGNQFIIDNNIEGYWGSNKLLEEICSKARQSWKLIEILIVHRYGKLNIKRVSYPLMDANGSLNKFCPNNPASSSWFCLD